MHVVKCSTHAPAGRGRTQTLEGTANGSAIRSIHLVSSSRSEGKHELFNYRRATNNQSDVKKFSNMVPKTISQNATLLAENMVRSQYEQQNTVLSSRSLYKIWESAEQIVTTGRKTKYKAHETRKWEKAVSRETHCPIIGTCEAKGHNPPENSGA